MHGVSANKGSGRKQKTWWRSEGRAEFINCHARCPVALEQLGELVNIVTIPLAGIIEPPESALPRVSKVLGQAPVVLGAALAERAKGKYLS